MVKYICYQIVQHPVLSVASQDTELPLGVFLFRNSCVVVENYRLAVITLADDVQ